MNAPCPGRKWSGRSRSSAPSGPCQQLQLRRTLHGILLGFSSSYHCKSISCRGPEASTKDPLMNREQDADSVPDSEATVAASCLQLDLGCLVFMLYVVRFSIHVCSLCRDFHCAA